MTQLQRQLQSYGACSAFVQWCGERTLAEAWRDCERADWLLWLLFRRAGKRGWPTIQTAYLCACDCAETALQFVPQGEDRPRLAIEARRRWCVGNATGAEVALAATHAAEAWSSAWSSAWSAEWSSAADAAKAWSAAAAAAEAHAAAAAHAAASAAAASDAAEAHAAAHRTMCELIRQRAAPPARDRQQERRGR